MSNGQIDDEVQPAVGPDLSQCPPGDEACLSRLFGEREPAKADPDVPPVAGNPLDIGNLTLTYKISGTIDAPQARPVPGGREFKADGEPLTLTGEGEILLEPNSNGSGWSGKIESQFMFQDLDDSQDMVASFSYAPGSPARLLLRIVQNSEEGLVHDIEVFGTPSRDDPLAFTYPSTVMKDGGHQSDDSITLDVRRGKSKFQIIQDD